MQYMYINKSNKLDYQKRFRIVVEYNKGKNMKDISTKAAVSRQTIYTILEKYQVDGLHGLEDHKTGSFKTPLNASFYANVVNLRKKYSWGACRLEKYFKGEGFSVSHNKINEVIFYEGLLRQKMGKRERPKYISYEADNINDQWHIDWSKDPYSKKELLVILDDKSRFIVFAGLFDSASAENSAASLRKAIEKYGAPKELISDNGSHFKNIHTRLPNEEMIQVEKEFGVKHIFIRPHHPQSNGKIERLFGSYKGEFPRMEYEKVTDCLSWMQFYNNERLHQSLDYKTPAQVYLV